MSEPRRFQVLVCRGPTCGDERDAQAVHRALREQIAATEAKAELDWYCCFGRCSQGPNVLVRELSEATEERRPSLATAPRAAAGATALYTGVSVERARQIVRGHLIGGRVQRQFVERPGATPDGELE